MGILVIQTIEISVFWIVLQELSLKSSGHSIILAFNIAHTNFIQDNVSETSPYTHKEGYKKSYLIRLLQWVCIFITDNPTLWVIQTYPQHNDTTDRTNRILVSQSSSQYKICPWLYIYLRRSTPITPRIGPFLGQYNGTRWWLSLAVTLTTSGIW